MSTLFDDLPEVPVLGGVQPRHPAARPGAGASAGDVDALPALAALSAEVDTAITTAVAGLRRAGYSWGEIAARLGVTRQAAHQRWATTTDHAETTRGAVAS